MEEGKLLKYFIGKQSDLVVNEMCKFMKIKPQSLYQYYKSRELKDTVKKKFTGYFKEDIFSEKHYQEYLKDNNNNIAIAEDNNTADDIKADGALEKTLQDLASANKLLAQANMIFGEAQRNFSESNKTLAETNQKLTTRFVDITENDGPKIPVTFDSKTIDLLVSISDFVVGKKFESSEEFLTLVNTRFHVAPQDTFLADTRKD